MDEYYGSGGGVWVERGRGKGGELYVVWGLVGGESNECGGKTLFGNMGSDDGAVCACLGMWRVMMVRCRKVTLDVESECGCWLIDMFSALGVKFGCLWMDKHDGG